MELRIKGKATLAVAYEHTAASVGSGLLEVFSTPDMIGLMENAAQASVLPYLEEGQGTVGIRMEVDHLAATPIGQTVWAESELVEIDGRMLTFKVSAYSNIEKIGEAVHKRCIIYNDRFLAKMNAKYGSGAKLRGE